MVAVETQVLAHYVCNSKSVEALLLAVQQSGLLPQPNNSLSEFKSMWLWDRTTSWRQKSLHGQFLTAMERLTKIEYAYQGHI